MMYYSMNIVGIVTISPLRPGSPDWPGSPGKPFKITTYSLHAVDNEILQKLILKFNAFFFK